MIGNYKVITLCGSTKFKDEFIRAQRDLTVKGNIVISVGLFGHADNEYVITDEVKEMLDDMHKRKIDMSDEIFVINKSGYIGNSTKSEIEYAISTGKKVSYLEPTVNDGIVKNIKIKIDSFEGEYAIAVLARLYDFPVESLQRNVQSGNYNKAYRFARNDEDYILRVSPANDDPEMMRQRMAYLAKHFGLGSPVVEPIASAQGNLVEVVSLSDGSWRLVTVTKVAPGVTYELVEADTIDDSVFFEIGRGLARLHNNSAAISMESAPPHWHEVPNCFTVLNPELFEDEEVVEQYLRAREQCIALSQAADRYGIVHGDLHFSNVIIDHSNTRITICDFDDVCAGYYAMDVAMLIFDLGVILQCDDKETLLPVMMQKIISGYNSLTQHSKLAFEDTKPFLKLLDASLYIQYHRYYAANPGQGGWLKFFFTGRRDLITGTNKKPTQLL